MSGAALGLGLLLAAAAPRAALPTGRAAYRMELAGVHVGATVLAIRCEASRCAATWTVDLVLPDEAGGERTHRVDRAEVDPAGRGADGAVPAMIAPAVLGAPGAAPGCVAARDERTGERGEACRDAAGRMTVMGVEMEVVPGADGLPDEVRIPAQRAVYRRDSGAAPPATPPRLFGTKVPGPSGARTFCGVALDAPDAATKPPAGLPPPRGPATAGPASSDTAASCRAVTLDWLARAEQAGHRGRVAVGVVRTAEGWAWHAWAEVQAGSRWVAVDPTFGEAPARSPRFTVARWTPRDEAGRLHAGERVLGCWGTAAR